MRQRSDWDRQTLSRVDLKIFNSQLILICPILGWKCWVVWSVPFLPGGIVIEKPVTFAWLVVCEYFWEKLELMPKKSKDSVVVMEYPELQLCVPEMVSVNSERRRLDQRRVRKKFAPDNVASELLRLHCLSLTSLLEYSRPCPPPQFSILLTPSSSIFLS